MVRPGLIVLKQYRTAHPPEGQVADRALLIHCPLLTVRHAFAGAIDSRAHAANTSTTPTININGLGGKTMTVNGGTITIGKWQSDSIRLQLHNKHDANVMVSCNAATAGTYNRTNGFYSGATHLGHQKNRRSP